MVEAITAWCERLKAERGGLKPLASDIEYLCRAYTDAKHANFWEFGVPRLLELLRDWFRQEESSLKSQLGREEFEAHRAEHQRIITALKCFENKYTRDRLQGEQLRCAERDLLFYVDEELAEHFFSSDDSLQRLCRERGLAYQ